MAVSLDGVHSFQLGAGCKGGLPGILEEKDRSHPHEMAAFRRVVRSAIERRDVVGATR